MPNASRFESFGPRPISGLTPNHETMNFSILTNSGLISGLTPNHETMNFSILTNSGPIPMFLDTRNRAIS